MSKKLLFLILCLCLIFPIVSAYIWQPIGSTSAAGYNSYLAVNKTSDLKEGTLTLTQSGANSSGIFSTAYDVNCYYWAYSLYDSKLMFDVDYTYHVNNLGTYTTNTTQTYKIFNLRTTNISALVAPPTGNYNFAMQKYRTGYLPCTGSGAGYGFTKYMPTDLKPVVALNGEIWAGDATYALASNTSTTFGNNTVINLDIRALDTGAVIAGTQLGIADATILDWRYTTDPTGLSQFSSTGSTTSTPLYIGENIIFSAYKTNAYIANHTEHLILTNNDYKTLWLSPVSNTTFNNTLTEINVLDAETGVNIQNSNLNIDSFELIAWDNQTSVTGHFNHYSSATDFISLYANAIGYTANIIYNSKVDGNPKSISLLKTNSSLGVNLTQLNIQAIDDINSNPLIGIPVEVKLSRQESVYDNTRASGYANFILDTTNITIVDIILSETTNYYGAAYTGINITGYTNYPIVARLARKTSVATPTYTATPYQTITPIITNVGGTPRNMTAAVCGLPSSNTNIVDIFKSNIACWGLYDRITQDLALAGIIIAFFAFVLSKWGKALGALVGAGVGFLLSLAAGLIPVWVFFALVIIAGLIFGLKLYGGGGK